MGNDESSSKGANANDGITDDKRTASQEVLDEMSFYGRSGSFLNPKAPPPAGAPPPPPEAFMGGSPDTNINTNINTNDAMGASSKDKKSEVLNSYQQQYAVGSPAIENYDYGSTSGGLGPLILNLKPVNTGQSNAKHLDNAALNEVVRRVRILNISLCSVTILVQLVDWIGNFFLFRWARLVMGVYLTFFSIIMILYELHNRTLARHIRDNLGILYTTGGRSFCYLLMGSMCIGQCNFVMYITGLLMLGNSFYSIYIGCRYSDFESVYAKEGIIQNNNLAKNGTQYLWTETQTTRFSSIGNKGNSNRPEREALLKYPR